METPCPLPTAVIGFGYWGKNFARVFNQSDAFDLVAICDQSDEKRSKALKQFPHTRVVGSVEEIGNDVQVVAVVTPTDSHFNLAQHFLERGKHVLVTKPMTRRVEDAVKLVAVAKAHHRCLFVDHTFVFHPAVAKLKEMMPKVGRPYFFLAQRMNLGLYQPDVNVVYDLMPHDLSILCYLLDSKIARANSLACRVAGLPQEDLAHSTVITEEGVYGMITASWLSPHKIRQFIIVGSDGMLTYDDVAVSEKVKYYDKGVSLESVSQMNEHEAYTSRISYRTGDLYSPALSNDEALGREVEEFFRAIKNPPLRDTYNRLNLRVMESLDCIVDQMQRIDKLVIPPVGTPFGEKPSTPYLN